MEIAVTVYTADHGYAWSSLPPGTPEADLDALLRLASETRPEFPSETDVDSGVVSDGRRMAVFTIRNVPGWDSEGRAAEYAAFALVPREDADAVDAAALLEDPFFRSPTHSPPVTIRYDGPPSTAPALDVPGRLLCRNRLQDLDAHAVGALLHAYADRSGRWIFRCGACTDFMDAETGPWRMPSNAAERR